MALKFTDEQLREHHAEGLSHLEIAKLYDATRGAVSGRCRRIGLTRSKEERLANAHRNHPSRKKAKVTVLPQPKKNWASFQTGKRIDYSKAELRMMLEQAVRNTK